MHPCPAVIGAQGIENLIVFVFADKGLCHTDAVDALRNICVQVALFIGLNLPCLSLLFLDKHNHHRQQRQTAQTDQRQSGVAEKHKYNNEEKVAKVCYGIHDTIAQKVA